MHISTGSKRFPRPPPARSQWAPGALPTGSRHATLESSGLLSRRRGAQRRHVFRGSKFFPRLSLRAPFSLLASYQIPMGSLCAFAGSKGRMSYADPNNYYLASSRAVPIGSTRSQIQTITQLPLARSWWPLRTPLRGPAVIPLTRIQAFASPPPARSQWAPRAFQVGF